jgi:hypothetical protein
MARNLESNFPYLKTMSSKIASTSYGTRVQIEWMEWTFPVSAECGGSKRSNFFSFFGKIAYVRQRFYVSGLTFPRNPPRILAITERTL